MAEFHIAALDIDLTVILDHPLIDGILDAAGMYVVLLHLQSAVLHGDIGGLIVALIGQKLRIGERRALQEPPAVGALLHRSEITQNGVVVITRRPVEDCGLLDRHGELAGIPAVIVIRADLEAELVAPLHGQGIKAEAFHVVISVAVQHLDLLCQQFLIILPDRERDAVRVIAVGIRLPILDIGSGHIDLSVFRHDPLIDGIQ